MGNFGLIDPLPTDAGDVAEIAVTGKQGCAEFQREGSEINIVQEVSLSLHFEGEILEARFKIGRNREGKLMRAVFQSLDKCP